MTDSKILKKIDAGRQFRSMVEFRAVVDPEDEDAKIVEGYATTFDNEYELGSFDDWNGYRVNVWEKIDRNAFDETDMKDVVFLYNHSGRVLARKRNKTLVVEKDDHGLKVRADLTRSDQGPGIYRDIKNGFIDRMSFQFTVLNRTRSEEKDDENKTIKVVNTITKIGKLYDVSAVSIPANDGTDISARSAIDGVIEELETERSRRLEQERKAKALALKIKLTEEV